MKKRLLSLSLAIVMLVLAIPGIALSAFATEAFVGVDSKWEETGAVRADTRLATDSEMIRFFQWYKGGEDKALAINTELDATCVAKINPALIAEGIFTAEDTLTAAYAKFCAYLKQMNLITPTNSDWQFGNVKQAGTFTEFKYYAHYHNSTLLLADTKVRSGDGNAYFAPEADFDKMMKDIMTYLLGKSVLVDAAGTPVTSQTADTVKVKDLKVTWSAEVAAVPKYTNLTNGTTALGFVSGRSFAGYNNNDQAGYRYTAPKDGQLVMKMDSINSDGTYKWNIMVNDEFRYESWQSGADDSTAEINAALAELGIMTVKAGDTITIVFERDGGKHFTPAFTATLAAKSIVRFLDKNGEEIIFYAVDPDTALPAAPYAAAAEGWIINGEPAATLPATVTGDMNIQYAGDFGITDVAVKSAGISVSSDFAVNLYLQADPYAVKAGVADDYGKEYWGEKQADGTFKVTVPGVAAKNMGKTVSLCLFQEFVGGDSVDVKELYTLVPTEILAAYADSDATAKEKAIAAAALDYAAAADAYFNGTALGADVKASLAAQDAAIAALSSDVERADNGEYVVDGVTLVLRDQVALKIRVMSATYTPLDADALGFTVSLEANGTSNDYTGFVYTEGDEGYSVTMTLGGIAPGNFDVAHAITVKDAASFPVSETFEYSVYDYIARTFDADAPEADLLRAIYALGVAANVA